MTGQRGAVQPSLSLEAIRSVNAETGLEPARVRGHELHDGAAQEYARYRHAAADELGVAPSERMETLIKAARQGG